MFNEPVIPMISIFFVGGVFVGSVGFMGAVIAYEWITRGRK